MKKSKDKKGSFTIKMRKIYKNFNNELQKLIAEQERELRDPNAINHTFDPYSEDIFHRRRRTGGSGYFRQ